MADEQKDEEPKSEDESKEDVTKPEEELVKPTDVSIPKVESTVEKEGEKVETPVVEVKKEETPKLAPKIEKPAPSGKFKDLIKEIEGLTTIELAELVKVLEERF